MFATILCYLLGLALPPLVGGDDADADDDAGEPRTPRQRWRDQALDGLTARICGKVPSPRGTAIPFGDALHKALIAAIDAEYGDEARP